MKLTQLSIFALFVLATLTTSAQSDKEMQTLFKQGEITYGGYGGPRVALSSFNGKNTWLVGGRGGVIFNSSFAVGGAGYGIANSPQFTNIDDNEVAYLEGGYGGLLLEYILLPNKLVHLSFPVVIGAGGLLYSDTRAMDGVDFDKSIIASTAFFVLEPGVELEINITSFMRFGAGVSYRYTNGMSLPNTPSNSFNALSVNASLKFGSF